VEPDRGEGAGFQPEADSFDATSNRRHLIEIRCGFAQLSRKEADAAYARVTEARDAYYRQLQLVARVTAEANPEAVRMAKEAAHREFRSRVEAARVRAHVELAATLWLDEINKINRGVGEERTRVKREHEEAARLDAELDRLTATAETSRTMAEAAEAACRAAQQGHGELDEAPGNPAIGSSAVALMEAQAAEESATRAAEDALAADAAKAAAQDAPPTSAAPEVPEAPPAAAATAAEPASAVPTGDPAGTPDETAAAVPPPAQPTVEFGGPRPPTIVRLLRRDRSAMNRLVDALAGADVDQRRRWQLLLSNFVDAVVAAAIDSGCLEFPSENRFWNQFDREQAREVARALAALGFRYDGMSQFADGRVPERRDLAVAVGEAGMYQVRVRNWPLPKENAALMSHVRVDTDLLLSENAPSFTMGELMRLLGWRSEQLADLWNEWPRLRPLLLAPSPI
jgi:hypothetical protein